MRVDRLLHQLRLCKTRGTAQRLIDEGHVRANGVRIERHSHSVSPGDVLTLPLGRKVRVIEVVSLPERRGPANEAQSHYRALDPGCKTDIAAGNIEEPEGIDHP